MLNLWIAIELAARWEMRKEAWQRFYGFTIGTADRTVTRVLADTYENRRMFARGMI